MNNIEYLFNTKNIRSGSALFSTCLINMCLQLECCRLTVYKFGRSLVHETFRMQFLSCFENSVDPDQLLTDLFILPGSIVQSVMCLTADTICLTADPGFTSLIPALYHTFVKVGDEIFSTAILLSYADSRNVVVSYK